MLVRSPSPSAAGLVLAAALLSPAAAAVEPAGLRPTLEVGPLVGGQHFFVHIRTAGASVAGLFLSLDGTPTVPVGALKPVFGLDVAAATLIVLPCDGSGRVLIDIPTNPGVYGPSGLDVPVFFQAVAPLGNGLLGASEAHAVRSEPTPVLPGFLVDVAATNLPVGYDSIAGVEVAHGDVDRDGNEDLVFFGGSPGTTLVTWKGDGQGAFHDASAETFPGYQPLASGALQLADVDGDNDLDALLGGGFDSSTTVPDELWLNTNGVFAPALNFPPGDGQTRSFEVADLDGDGLSDLVLGVGPETHLPSSGGKDRLYFADGAGGWTESIAFRDAPWNDPNLPTTVIRSGDLDNDGFLDLIVGRQDTSSVDGIPGQPNSLLLNVGNGSFADQSALLFSNNPSDNTQDVALADLDLDGDLDLVVANSHGSVPASQSGELFVNQGGAQAGTLGFLLEDTTSELEISTPADWIRLSVVTADMDADGDPDVIMGVHDLFAGADQLIFLNQGGVQMGVAGSLVRQTWFDPGDFICYGVAAFDADHDGDRDLLMLGDGVVSGDPTQGERARLFENTTL
ncbi:MAG: VCBS repeat-containing protein [Planctomycetes bacterium]|nr:VCBS repeat-containing protein [Planctomycetota bacterium]